METNQPVPAILAGYPPGTRVRTPGGIPGTVIRVSLKLKHAPILVRLDTNLDRAFAPSQVVKIVGAPRREVVG